MPRAKEEIALASNLPKTLAAFEKFRLELYGKPIPALSTENPFLYALKRKELAIERLKELIKVAEGVEGITIGKKLIGWKRQLARMTERGEKLRTCVREFGGNKFSGPLVSGANSEPTRQWAEGGGAGGKLM